MTKKAEKILHSFCSNFYLYFFLNWWGGIFKIPLNFYEIFSAFSALKGENRVITPFSLRESAEKIFGTL